MSIITSDIILSKMAKRELHPWVVVFSMASIFSHFLIIVLVAFYYASVFWELCDFSHLPLLTICRNVYVDGIFDLCHIGHKNLFKNALTFGNRLLVGVVSDEEATPYKRKPIMTMQVSTQFAQIVQLEKISSQQIFSLCIEIKFLFELF